MSYNKYYLSVEQINEIATHGLIIFDTSALLSIYGLSLDAQNDIFDNVLDKMKDRLWLPERVYFEFQKNYATVSSKPIKQYINLLSCERKIDGGYVDKIINTVQTEIGQNLQRIMGQYKALKDMCKENQKHPIIPEREFAVFEDALDRFNSEFSVLEKKTIEFKTHLKDIVDNTIQTIQNQIKNDLIPEKISVLFKVGDEFSFEKLFMIAQEGNIRYDMELPPGYGDRNDKEGLAIYGDLIVWKQLIEYAEKEQKSVLFVSNDMKPDWFDRENDNAPRIELLQEFNSETKGQRIWIMNFSDFLHLVSEININKDTPQVNDTTLQEVEKVIIDINEDAQNVADEEEIADNGYRKISERNFLSKLDSNLSYFQGEDKFLSSRYFVETILASEGYDIRSSWEMFNHLKAQERIMEYKHDPKNGYPKLSAICFPTDI